MPVAFKMIPPYAFQRFNIRFVQKVITITESFISNQIKEAILQEKIARKMTAGLKRRSPIAAHERAGRVRALLRRRFSSAA
jgi:hypothetical protein